MLAVELSARRLIDYLQSEALRLLCLAGSRHLLELSEGTYRLDYDGDEFHVLDAENGDERRHVRTLSGGETFLASLSLALALAEQVRSLAVTDRAPLESLFLDEGFGALDPETLERVAGAIQHLGSEGRMVGVVTHVRELANELPVRIEVERADRGSRLRVAS
jgi:DNA repair protein SbcC/Rad50